MKFLRLLALILVGCNPITEAPKVETPKEIPLEVIVVEPPYHEASPPIGPEYPVKDTKKVFTVKVEDLNYTKAQKAKLAEATKIIEKIFNSPEYKQEVLSRKFTSTKISNEEIYEKLFRGAENLQPAVNYQMDLKVKMYYKKRSRVVGYTYPSSLIVHTNSKYHNKYSACKVASNLVHEWTHKMGFGHSSAGDSSSVPYSHNNIIEKLCPKFL